LYSSLVKIVNVLFLYDICLHCIHLYSGLFCVFALQLYINLSSTHETLRQHLVHETKM